MDKITDAVQTYFGWLCEDTPKATNRWITRFMRSSWDVMSARTECGCCIAVRMWLLGIALLLGGFGLGVLTRYI